MAKDHWQIYNWGSKKKGDVTGAYEVFKIEDVPKKIIDIAIKATRLIGNGLYGVDVKEVDGKAYIIEINDNPNIDAGVEDLVIKDVYMRVIKHLLNQVER
jgi:glutathione synthase/RimK-type ligase-like ATP-grasp enzyme